MRKLLTISRRFVSVPTQHMKQLETCDAACSGQVNRAIVQGLLLPTQSLIFRKLAELTCSPSLKALTRPRRNMGRRGTHGIEQGNMAI
jgi:hypothetical protein